MKKKRYNLKKIRLSLKARLFSDAFWGLGFLALSIFFFLKALANATVQQLFYSETSILDYQVCLKANEYFSERCLAEDRQYIANIIDYIDTDFKYNLMASSAFDYNYSYYINAQIIANEKGNPNKILYNKEEILLPETKVTKIASTGFTIDGNLLIDYAKYNDLMVSFRKNYTLTLDSRLVITLYIKLDGKYAGIDERIKINRNLNLTIPLSEQTLDISLDYQEINDSKLMKNDYPVSKDNILLYFLSGGAFILALLFSSWTFKLFIKIVKSKTIFEKTLKKILKEYNQIIVEIKKMPMPNASEVIEVSNFSELLDVRETINKPILYLPIDEQKALFIIISTGEIYRFVLRAENL